MTLLLSDQIYKENIMKNAEKQTFQCNACFDHAWSGKKIKYKAPDNLKKLRRNAGFIKK